MNISISAQIPPPPPFSLKSSKVVTSRFVFPSLNRPGRAFRSYSDERSTVELIEKASDAAVEPETTDEEVVKEIDKVDVESTDFLNNLDLKDMQLKTEDSFNILIYGSSALVALLLASGIVSAIDSLPVFPKVMEVVGLGFSVWFGARYLIFKNNRDELYSQIESLKEQIIGRTDN